MSSFSISSLLNPLLPTYIPIEGAEGKEEEILVEIIRGVDSSHIGDDQERCEESCVGTVEKKVDEKLKDLKKILQPYIKRINDWLIGKEISPPFLVQLKTKIDTIVEYTRWNTEWKIAELNLLYYYLEKSNGFPLVNSFVLHRSEEINGFATRLKEHHNSVCTPAISRLLPSGAVAYIQQELCALILTNKGFNLGGCHTVRLFLNSKMGLILGEELRTQILTIVNYLITDRDFHLVLMESFEVHKNLESIIKKDMKIPISEKINALHIRRALLLMLFSLIGQEGEGNCFAIAFKLNYLNRHPATLVRLLINSLKTGVVEMDGCKIPISIIMSSREEYEKDFRITITREQVENLTVYQWICEVLKVDRSLANIDLEFTTLGEILEKKFGSHLDFAKGCFLSYKFNYSQQMLISIFSFISINTMSTKDVSQKLPATRRNFLDSLSVKVISKVHSLLAPQFKDHTEVFSKLISRVNENLNHYFFFIDHRCWDAKVERGWLQLDRHGQGLKLEVGDGELPHNSPYRFIRRLYYSNTKGGLTPVDSITDLLSLLCKIVDRENLPEHKEILAETLDEFEKMTNSDLCRQPVSEILENENDKKLSLTSYSFLKADSILILQRGCSATPLGGWEWMEDKLALPNSFSKKVPQEYFESICKFVADFVEKNPHFLRERYFQILTGSRTHLFNLTPMQFGKYWQQDSIISEEINNINKIGESVLKQLPSSTIKKEFVFKLILDSQRVLKAFEIVGEEEMDFELFIDTVFSLATKEERTGLALKVESMLETISVKKLIYNLRDILKHLDIKLDTKEIKALGELIDKSTEIKTLVPYQWAKHLQGVLLKTMYFLNASVNELELIIRTVFQLPDVVPLGNLNWVGFYEEHKESCELVLKYCYVSRTLVLYARERGICKPMPQHFLDGLSSSIIFFEKTSTL